MLALFRSNHPLIILFLFLYAVALRLFLFTYHFSPTAEEHANYLSTLVFGLLHRLFKNHDWMYYVLSVVIVVLQAIYFNYLVNYYRILSKNTYLPAMSFILISSLFMEFCLLTPSLFANSFLLIAVSRILSIYKKENVGIPLFDAGLLIAIASLFYFPYLVFFLFVIISILTLRPFNLREIIFAILGLTVPYYLVGVYFFWNNRLPDFLHTITISGLNFPVDQIKFSFQISLTGTVMALVTLWSLFFIQRNFLRMLVQVRSYIAVFIFIFLAGIFAMIIQFNGEMYHFIWLTIPLGLAFSIFFLESKRRWLSEMLHLFLILTILIFEFQSLLK